ncbi:HlyD family secretion protein [Tepidibacter aestuarii]|uniref:HlyD family secretion protein n=1 Tax=Tepidibacter aestuarii TaxID=2925782 RepID=UPI0020C0629A|nr:HlyD family efflux transporter periplasmic adaptor subunit [Tepidibacter aestuarii]CAH2214745.1 putative HlyD family efflux transporter periplasmic adaptor subunit [Tepidibacter aestuarii]
MKKKTMVSLLLVVVVFGIVGFMIYKSNQPLVVKTVQLEKINYEEYHYEEGSVEPKKRMKVFSNGSGKIIDLFIEAGSAVKKGDAILSIDDDDLKYQLDILYAQKNSLAGEQKSEEQIVKNSELKLQEEAIELAKYEVDSVKKDLERKRKLFESGAISKTDFEQIEDQYKQAVGKLNIENFKFTTLKDRSKIGSGKNLYYAGQVEKIDLQIKQLEEKIDKMKVIAPIDGTISNLSLDKGDYISENQMLFEIFHAGLYEVESYVLAKEVKKLKIGMTAYLEVENQSKIETIKGKITFIAPNAIEVTSPLGLVEKKVKVLVEPQEDVKLIQGEEVDVKFITYSKDKAQVVSKDYIFPWMEGEGMWIIDDGKAKVLKIDKEFDSSSNVVLGKDIDEQTKVIITPYPEKIEEGAKVISK